MDKEAIKEIAEQLGKGVNWVEDELVPYMYNYAEYRFIFCTVLTAVLGLVFITGICLIWKGNKHRLKEDKDWLDDTDFTFIFVGAIVAFIGIVGCMLALASALSWWIAPEVTFITKIAGQ